ncbi:alpha/beta hydrolase [Geminicoccus roseus]|uniref:alpha/beta hydrolase n=1 Tax=Geminicoccus roseus TaxID=404900 RepID=UPI0004120954|nr:alpha/beta hydrolase [Geminicoccus roseus]
MTLPDLICDPAEVDRLYDAGKAVADSARHTAGWTSDSADARARLRHLADLPYGPTAEEYLDVFPGPAGGPVHVFIHGGYWRRFSAKDFSFVAGPLVEQGHTVVVPNYALCPQVGIAEIVRQMRAALRWVVLNEAVHGGDPRRLTISGHSAGGHLVAMMLATDWSRWRDMPSRPVQAAVALSGIYDLAPLAWSWLQPVLQLDHHQVQQLSPARQVRPGQPPLVLAAGGEESQAFHAQASRYAAASGALGNRVEQLSCPGRDHFTILAELPGLAERISPR